MRHRADVTTLRQTKQTTQAEAPSTSTGKGKACVVTPESTTSFELESEDTPAEIAEECKEPLEMVEETKGEDEENEENEDQDEEAEEAAEPGK